MSCKCSTASMPGEITNEHLRLRYGVDVEALSDNERNRLRRQYWDEEMEQEMMRDMLDRQREDEDDDEDKKEEDDGVGDEWLRNYFRSSVVRRIPRTRMPPNPPRS